MINVKSHYRKTKTGRTSVKRHLRKESEGKYPVPTPGREPKALRLRRRGIAIKEKIKKRIVEKAKVFNQRSREERLLVTVSYDIYPPRGKKYTIGVNWSAIGTTGIKETEKFIQSLQEAKKIVASALKTGIFEEEIMQ